MAIDDNGRFSHPQEESGERPMGCTCFRISDQTSLTKLKSSVWCIAI